MLLLTLLWLIVSDFEESKARVLKDALQQTYQRQHETFPDRQSDLGQ